jgi:hypothetical protein
MSQIDRDVEGFWHVLGTPEFQSAKRTFDRIFSEWNCGHEITKERVLEFLLINHSMNALAIDKLLHLIEDVICMRRVDTSRSSF